eukprot:jgi/Psemu1/7033/gm1.7033_g
MNPDNQPSSLSICSTVALTLSRPLQDAGFDLLNSSKPPKLGQVSAIFLEDLIKKAFFCPELTREALFDLNQTGELTVKIPNNPKYSNGLPLILCTIPQSGTIAYRNPVSSPQMLMSEHFHDFPSEYTPSLVEYDTAPYRNPDNPLPDYTCFLPEFSTVAYPNLVRSPTILNSHPDFLRGTPLSGTFPIAPQATPIGET